MQQQRQIFVKKMIVEISVVNSKINPIKVGIIAPENKDPFKLILKN
jgi:hypothetical protein